MPPLFGGLIGFVAGAMLGGHRHTKTTTMYTATATFTTVARTKTVAPTATAALNGTLISAPAHSHHGLSSAELKAAIIVPILVVVVAIVVTWVLCITRRRSRESVPADSDAHEGQTSQSLPPNNELGPPSGPPPAYTPGWKRNQSDDPSPAE